MKKITFLLTLLIISVSFGQTNLIVNGDFETLAGSNNFADWNDHTNITAESANTVDGTQCVRMSSLLNWCKTDQDVTVEAGATYNLSFSGRIQDAGGASGTNTNTGHVLNLQIREGVASGNWVVVCSIDQPTNQTVSGQFTVPAGITAVKVRLSKDNGIAYVDNVSMIKGTLGIDDLKQFSFRTYPNPATDYINLSAAKNINKVEIYSLLGQRVKNITLNSNTAKVNVSGLSKGVYVVKAFIEDAVGTYKFVKE